MMETQLHTRNLSDDTRKTIKKKQQQQSILQMDFIGQTLV